MGTQAHLAVFREPLLEMLGSPYRLCRTSPKEGSLTAAKQPLLCISFLASEHCSGEMILHLDRGDVRFHIVPYQFGSVSRLHGSGAQETHLPVQEHKTHSSRYLITSNVKQCSN